MKKNIRHNCKASINGFSLIELMVGMALGLIGMVIVYRVLATSEEYRRTSSKLSASTENGAISIMYLERDLRQAGYGLQGTSWYMKATSSNPSDPVIGTDGPPRMTNIYNCIAQGGNSSTTFTLQLTPVLITNGGLDANSNPAPDTISILYGNAATAAFPASLTSDVIAGATQLQLNSANQFRANDFFLIVDPTLSPALCEIGVVASINNNGVTLNLSSSGAYFHTLTNSYTGDPDPDLASAVFNLGPSPTQVTYSITSNGRASPTLIANYLFNAAQGGDIADNVVNMQAQYVLNSGQAVDSLTSPNSYWNVRAIRIALVTRSDNREKDEVSPASIAILPSSGTTNALIYNLSPEERHYRYRIIQTIVNLRNRTWNP